MSYKSGGSSLADQSFAWGPDLSGAYAGAGLTADSSLFTRTNIVRAIRSPPGTRRLLGWTSRRPPAEQAQREKSDFQRHPVPT